MIVGGIDEAGRGPIIGPLVICLFMMDDSKAKELSSIGVRDSKMLSPSRREKLFDELADIGTYQVHVSTASEIDARDVSLNDFEIRIMAGLLEQNPSCKRVFIDSIQADGAAFTRKLKEKMKCSPELVPEILAIPGGDIHFPTCSAASIIAKVTRDRSVLELHKDYGNFGSGYPSDPKTRVWLQEKYAAEGRFPPIVRHTWRTAIRFTETRAEDNA